MVIIMPYSKDTGTVNTSNSLASILDFQHCTDEAQKAETVLSAVSYIYIYIYIYIFNIL